MKSSLFTISALLLCAGSAQAQFGLRAGANFATLATKTSSPYQRASASGRLGYQLGVFYEKKLTSRWSIVPELQVSRQHQNVQVEEFGIADGGYYGAYRLALTYLSLPVLVRANVGKFYFEAGPQMAVLQAAHETGTETIGTFVGSFQRDFDRAATDRYRRFDIALCAGAGVRLPAGFSLGLRASTGLLSLTHVPEYVNYAGNLKNQVVQAALCYQRKPKS